MDIKLRARLSAYAKVSSIESPSNNLPSTEYAQEGDIVGVNGNGEFTMVSSVEQNEIDTLFDSTQEPESVKKDDIDTLFEKEETDDESTVTHSQIDSLFDTDEEGE